MCSINRVSLYFRHNAFDLDDAVARKNQKFAHNHRSNNNVCFGRGSSSSAKNNVRFAAAEGKEQWLVIYDLSYEKTEYSG